MSEAKQLKKLRQKSKIMFTISKPSYLTTSATSKLLISKNNKSHTPTRLVQSFSSGLRNKSKTPIDKANLSQNNLNRPISSSRSSHKNQKTTPNTKRKSSETSQDKLIHVHVNKALAKKESKITIQTKKNFQHSKSNSETSTPLRVHKKTLSSTFSSNTHKLFNHSLLIESRNKSFTSKLLYKKKQNDKEKLLSNSRSPSFKSTSFFSNFQTIHAEKNYISFTEDRFKKNNQRNLLFGKFPFSPSNSYKNKTETSISMKSSLKTSNKKKKINVYKSLEASPIFSNKLGLKKKAPYFNYKRDEQSKSPILGNNNTLFKKDSASIGTHSSLTRLNSPITIQTNKAKAVINNQKRHKEYPNRVSLINISQSQKSKTEDQEYEQTIPSSSVSTFRKNFIGKKIAKIESISKKGFAGENIKKINQDKFFIYHHFNSEENCMFLGVCDGHGLFGHEVSNYLANNLPQALSSAFASSNISSIKKGKPESFNQIITGTFIRLNSELILSPEIDTTFSGSTCVSLIYTTTSLICANAGDSRCVVGKYIKGEWVAKNLSNDHKPGNQIEMERILKSGGKVEPYRDLEGKFVGPDRVWVKGDDVPGLAMSRSFGDDIAQSVGVTPEPEIISMELKEEDKFVIIASDGIWEFISSEDCVNMIKNFYQDKDVVGALNFVYKEAAKRWIMEEEVIDDITVIIIFFED